MIRRASDVVGKGMRIFLRCSGERELWCKPRCFGANVHRLEAVRALDGSFATQKFVRGRMDHSGKQSR
jgi:hypothetical protein